MKMSSCPATFVRAEEGCARSTPARKQTSRLPTQDLLVAVVTEGRQNFIFPPHAPRREAASRYASGKKGEKREGSQRQEPHVRLEQPTLSLHRSSTLQPRLSPRWPSPRVTADSTLGASGWRGQLAPSLTKRAQPPLTKRLCSQPSKVPTCWLPKQRMPFHPWILVFFLKLCFFSF